ncbi:hypothetical protein K3495_g6127 [Podosphaera aphanis]|nr:hypothetical protein K3495_g6127 [Podosphaera aphanis]
MTTISYPTSSSLPSNTLLPTTHTSVRRTLNRLSRPALISLALDWLADVNQTTTAPYLQTSDEDNDDLYPPVPSLEELRWVYKKLGEQGGTKRDIVERILKGDWRNGVSLYALAMADMQFLYSHPTSQKWLALEILPLFTPASTVNSVPRFHPATFLRNLQRECLPDVKAHYSLDRHDSLPLLILRIWVLESPYNTTRALATAAEKSTENHRTFYVAFPDFSPYIYISSANTLASAIIPGARKARDSRSLRQLIVDAIPKAFSRPRERYTLHDTGLSTKNIEALVAQRGSGRTNAAGGAWGMYAETKGARPMRDNPLRIESFQSSADTSDQDADELGQDQSTASGVRRPTVALPRKRSSKSEDLLVRRTRQRVAQSRFGNAAVPDDCKGIERLEVRIEDPFPTTVAAADVDSPDRSQKFLVAQKDLARHGIDESRASDTEVWRPSISVIFAGSHVFAGIRKLVECGVVDGLQMPGWMTGEQGISVGVVREGRMQRVERK